MTPAGTRLTLFGLAFVLTSACSGDGPSGLEELPADSLAAFTVTFDGTWSAATHPASFPPGPHFSGLIGATHDSRYIMWGVGEVASLGIKEMAELGSKTALTQEVEQAIATGTAGAVVSGGGIVRSPGFTSATVEASTRHPLLSLTSMIAPSPDWFVGVAGLNLRPGGEWLDSVTVELLAYDAGTDSGVSYRSANAVTAPPVPVSLIANVPFDGTPPLGTFTIVRR